MGKDDAHKSRRHVAVSHVGHSCEHHIDALLVRPLWHKKVRWFSTMPSHKRFYKKIPVWGSWLKTWSWSQSFLAKMPRNFSLQNLGHSVFNFWSLFIYFKNLILNKPCTHWISSQGTPFGNILAIGWTQTN